MSASQTAEGRTRWIVADFSSARWARLAADGLRDRGYAAHVVVLSPSEAFAGDEGIVVVRIGVGAWLGLLVGLIVGLVLGILVWNGQLVIAPLAPALASGRTAVPVLGAGILGALGWLTGALLPLGLGRSVSQVVVRAPAGDGDVVAVERELIDRGAWNVRVTSAVPEPG
ncbi:MAG: hypothetical protein ACRDIY_03150 [Chloroflexota bacterium]